MKLTNAEGRELLAKKGKKPSREGNKLTEYNGNTYHSSKEAARAQELDWMVRTGVIKSYARQVPLKCEINGLHLCTYVCDFVVEHWDKLVFEDVKGRKSGGPYQLFKLKARLVKVCLGIDIVEV